LAPLLNKKLRRKLKPVFETRVRRTVYPLRRNGSEIELSVDTGQVDAAGQSSPLCEVELELKTGEPRELFDLARTLANHVAVQLASRSKAEYGYALIGGEPPGSVNAQSLALPGDADWGFAFKIIARACLYQIVANTAALQRHDAEAMHQMRVGLRKLRAAIALFKDMLAGAQTEAIKAELKWITAALGSARELDVFVERVVKPVGYRKERRSGMGAVVKDFQDERAGAIERAGQAVASARFRRLTLDVAAALEIGDWTRRKDKLRHTMRQRPVAAAAADELQRRSRKIRKEGARLGKLDARRRHELRIEAKKLRYACEFFADAFPGRKASRRRERFIARLTELQDTLGDLNDIMVHESLAQRAIAGPNGRRGSRAGSGRGAQAARKAQGTQQAFAAGRLSGREEARFAPAMRLAERAADRFAKASPFWN
jgi:inorganic triphosphatase YgiF